MSNRTDAQKEATQKMRSALEKRRTKASPWQSASSENTNNPRHLGLGPVSVRANVHANDREMETLIHDLNAPRDERWTSIILDRHTGAVGVGRHRDSKEAWKLARADMGGSTDAAA